MKWTLNDIEKKKLKIVSKKTTSKPIVKVPQKEPAPIGYIKSVLKKHRITFECEHKFAEGRRFRMDIAIREMKIGIEYEGLVAAKSRHTTLTGYSNDCSKYNLAQKIGWVVLRYTVMNYKEFETDFIELLKNKTNGQN